MSGLRTAWRLTRLAVGTAWWYTAMVVGSLLLLPAPRPRLHWRRWVMRRWGQSVCGAIAVQVEAVGTPPPPGSFLVCNHLGYLDIPVIASQLGARFVSRADVVDWPIAGRMARAGGTIFVERARKRQLHSVNDEIASVLAGGYGVVVFPEGTSTRGAEILPFRPSLLAPAAAAELEVYSACLSYATGAGDPPPSLSVCWWGDMALMPHILAMLRLQRVSARLEFVPGSVRDTDRKRLAEKLWQAVNARFRPLP